MIRRGPAKSSFAPGVASGGDYNYDYEAPGSNPYQGHWAPKSMSLDDKYNKRRPARLSNPIMLLSIGTVLFFCTTFYYRSNANYWQKQVGQHHSEQTKVLERKLHSVEEHSRTLQNHVERHESHAQNLVDEHTAQTELMWHDDEVEEHVDDKLTALWDRVDDLREHVQSFSHRSVLDRFGPGPHQVTMEIEVEAGDVHVAGGVKETHYYTETVTLELAPLDLMPHTIHMFLEQVFRGLWDETSFIINGPHVAQVSPFTHDDEDVRDRFKDVNLHGLSFQEYSPEYPHVQYTLGITGRPGGPDFYINKNDNTEIHGPYGQEGKDMEEEADPCFGRVVSGFETLDYVFGQPTSDKGSGYYLDHHIERQISGPDEMSVLTIRPSQTLSIRQVLCHCEILVCTLPRSHPGLSSQLL
eukprot:scaffold81805_cov50-Attheya_sp.AAC.1